MSPNWLQLRLLSETVCFFPSVLVLPVRSSANWKQSGENNRKEGGICALLPIQEAEGIAINREIEDAQTESKQLIQLFSNETNHICSLF